MARKRTTPEEQQQIVMMYSEQKMTQAKIAEATGLTPSGVAGVLHRHGIRSRSYGGLGGNRKYKLTAEQSELIARLYGEGESCESISTVIGVPWLVVNRRLKEQGVTLRPRGFRKGEGHHGWKGGRLVVDGYIQVLIRSDEPYFCMGQKKAGDIRYVFEHRLVMAKHLGRVLEDHETVHHKDGVRDHNDIDNLQLRTGRHGKGTAFVCSDCGSCNIVATELN